MNITRLLLALTLALSLALGSTAQAAKPQDSPITITEINPARDVGYHVGDILHRTIILKAPKSYRLLQTSLPLAGTEKKYRGQKQGIEVRSAELTGEEKGDFKYYTLKLSYQVFTNNVVAKPSQLPAEYVKFGGEGRVIQVRIPYWPFRISPLAVYGSVKIEYDMSPLRGPLLLSDQVHRQVLWTAAAILGLSLLGLLYILGNRTWLPRMGGSFSKAYRDLKKIRRQQLGLDTGVTRIHQALNQSAGGSVFTTEEFLARKPNFAAIREEIAQFFRLSRRIFFDPSTQHGIQGDEQLWLQQFCRNCRDCERGLGK